MKRTTVFVPEALERDLQLYASREAKPTAAIVREALAEYIARRRPGGMLPSFAGAFASGHADTAERHEELLFKGVTPYSAKKGRRQTRKTRGESRRGRRRR